MRNVKRSEKPAGEISTEAIRAHLDDVLASPMFVNAGRISRFLRFVVEESLHGRAEQIGEQKIGFEVYDRPDSFDPRLDSIVRVEAGRLRSKLREYYESAATNGSMRIEFLKGSYAPVFHAAGPKRTENTLADTSRVRAIAVLPFADLSPLHDHEYFGDGLAEELMYALSRLGRFRVASQTSTLALKGSDSDVREIARKLGVDAVLEGSVRNSGTKLRVAVHLVNGRSGFDMWSEVYDSELNDIFLIQEQISRAVARSLVHSFVDNRHNSWQKASTESLAAYNLYLKGRHLWNRQTYAALKSAIQEFEFAIAKDPHYARAHAGISDCYRLLEMWGALSPEEAIPLAKKYALRALELDPSLAEARCAVATLKAVYEWDWKAAEREFQQVFEQQPDHSIAHQEYGMMCLAPQGRTEEALRELRIARDLDPLGLWVNSQLCFALLLDPRYHHEAAEQCRKTLELDDHFYLAHMLLGVTYAMQGELKPALEALERAHARGGENPRILGWLGYVHALSGARTQALGILEELEGTAKSQSICPLEMAKIHLGLGDTAQTLKKLEEAAERRFGRLVLAIVDPIYEPVRSEPAFAAIRARMNLS